MRVLIVEDDARYLDSLQALIANTPGLELAASFADAPAALAWCLVADRAPFDVALMDISLPSLSGIEATRQIKQRFADTRVIMLTVFEEPRTILDAICAGADGYLLKKTSARDLVAQVHAIAGGAVPMTAGVARTVLGLVRRLGAGSAPPEALLRLTEREQDVLRGLVDGLAYKEVAGKLDISLDTVRTHVRGLYKKLQVHTVAAAVARAIRDGLV